MFYELGVYGDGGKLFYGQPANDDVGIVSLGNEGVYGWKRGGFWERQEIVKGDAVGVAAVVIPEVFLGPKHFFADDMKNGFFLVFTDEGILCGFADMNVASGNGVFTAAKFLLDKEQVRLYENACGTQTADSVFCSENPAFFYDLLL